MKAAISSSSKRSKHPPSKFKAAQTMIYLEARNPLLNRRWSLTIVLLMLGFVASAQSIENVRAEFSDKMVRIHYDLNGKPEQRFKIVVFGSHNNYSSPLRLVSGAVGEGLAPGKDKVIDWRVGDELVSFAGQVVFRLKGELLAGPLSLQPHSGPLKAGKNTTITWVGGNPSSSTRLELLQNGTVIKSIHEGSNSGSFIWKVPKDVKKGSYQLRISSGNETPPVVPVEVKAGMPLWMKLAPVGVAAIVAVIIFLPDGGGGGDDDLPDAPIPD
jgi:hypothetical protein